MVNVKDRAEISESELNILNPSTDEDFFAIARILAKRHSTCLKTRTAVLIVDKNKKILSWGVNMCCPQDQLYGLPVTECPRMNTQTGTSYALCMPIHAEVVACLNAFGINTADRKKLWHFPGFTKQLREYQGFFESKGAVLYLVGHYWACDECVVFAKSVGIEDIKFDNISGGSTLQSYKDQGLAKVEDSALDASGVILSGIITIEISKSKVRELCEEHNIDRTSVKPFLNLKNTFTLCVPTGQEQGEATRLKEDSRVKDARTIYLN